jgi:CheY-like chemotaxis protein
MSGMNGKLRVLVVDDDRDVQDLLSDLFRRAGYDVEVAGNGADAIDTLEHSAPPAAILVDLLMPGVVGQELLEYVQSSDHLADVAVAIVSGSPHLAPSGFRVFGKPIEFGTLLEFVRGATS